MNATLSIPIFDPSSELLELKDQLNKAIEDVLLSGQFILGHHVQTFEKEVADYFSVKHAIGLNSGTDALVISLRALDIGPGDEVITTAFTFFATAEAIVQVGAIPVFVDIDPVTYAINPKCVAQAITSRTKALLPVHLYGLAANMNDLMAISKEFGIAIIEDCAQSFGARHKGQLTGTFGNTGALSFFPTKNLGAFGDGGMMITSSDELADRARQLRAHGSKIKYWNERIGYNSRLDELQAAILRVKLPFVEQRNAERKAIAGRYGELLKSIPDIVLPKEAMGDVHVYHQYTIRIKAGKRDVVAKRLRDAGIGTAVYYPVVMPALQPFRHAKIHFDIPEAMLATQEVLSLPMFPGLSFSQQEHIAAVLRASL